MAEWVSEAWFREKGDLPFENPDDLLLFQRIGFDIGGITTPRQVLPLLDECYRVYYEMLPSTGILNPDAFARCRNYKSQYSLADIIEGRAKRFYLVVLYKLIGLHYASNPKHDAGSKYALGKMCIMLLGGTAYVGVGGFSIERYRGYLEKYCPIGGTVWDPSMGWGNRLTAATQWNCGKYLGTDPSTDMWPAYNDFIKSHKYTYAPDIRCQGSEVFVPEWENTVDLVVTCPPYYKTEIYPSVTNDDVWPTWGDYAKFVFATCVNAHRYLKEGGIHLEYVGDNDDYNVSDLYLRCFQAVGFRNVHKKPVTDNPFENGATGGKQRTWIIYGEK